MNRDNDGSNQITQHMITMWVYMKEVCLTDHDDYMNSFTDHDYS